MLRYRIRRETTLGWVTLGLPRYTSKEAAEDIIRRLAGRDSDHCVYNIDIVELEGDTFLDEWLLIENNVE